MILLFVFYQWQFYVVFSPTHHRENELGNGCQLLSMKTDDGVELEGAIYEAQDATNTLLVFVGRSHDGVGLINKLALTYPKSRIIVFNYRSYGKSKGVLNERNILSDGVKIAQLVEKNYGEYYILGFSIGSSVAAYVATKLKCKGLFLVGAFDSISGLAKEKYLSHKSFKRVDISKLLRYKFHTKEFVKSIEVDTYLFVSKSDEITYLNNSRELKQHVKNLKYYSELENLTHKELLWDSGVVDIIKEVIE
ncbi:alpha/beta hydrolase [Sulfurimonas aquatica]|nr:alpha/beta hydrolase [Sulfurimonas aquatica]